MSVIARVPALAPFGVRSFRFQWPADLLASWAFEMEGVILGWFVLVATGSVLALAIFGSLQFLGTLISPFYGMAGDRFGNRNLLCAMRTTYICTALILTVLFATGNVEYGFDAKSENGQKLLSTLSQYAPHPPTSK